MFPLENIGGFLEIGAQHGLYVYLGKLSAEECARAALGVQEAVSALGRKLTQERIQEVELPNPYTNDSSFTFGEPTGMWRRNLYVMSDGTLRGDILPWRMERVEWLRKYYPGSKVQEMSPLRQRVIPIEEMLQIWDEEPENGSAAEGNYGLISERERKMYTPETLVMLLQIMAATPVNQGKVDYQGIRNEFKRQFEAMLQQQREENRKKF